MHMPEESRRVLERFQRSIRSSPALPAAPGSGLHSVHAPLLPPGPLMYLRPVRAPGAGKGGFSMLGWFKSRLRRSGGASPPLSCEGSAVECSWEDPGALVDEGILLSADMLRDHLPDVLCARLADAARASC